MISVEFCLFETPLGWCGIAWRSEAPDDRSPAVVGFQLPESTRGETARRIARQSGGRENALPPEAITAIIARVGRHLDGEPEDFQDVAIDLASVEPFARRVYEATRQIRAGTTRTYGEIARSLDQPGAAQAVGQALGRNPVALLVPCHRVIAAGGKPGGFSAHGGLSTKTRILDIEREGR